MRWTMKGIILYKSKYGSTREYSEMLSKELGFSSMDLEKDYKPTLDVFDIVIIGGWILASSMKTSSWIKKNWSRLKGKHVILFSVSGAKPDEKLKKEFLEKSLPDDIAKEVIFFPLRGRFIVDKLNFGDRSMMKIASKLFKDDDLVRDLSTGIDDVNLDNLKPLIDHVNSLNGK
jgi:menaquinone-dependent protoporphyrinogen IX oxidase